MAKSAAPDPMDEVRSNIRDLQDSWKETQEKVLLAAVRDEVEDVETRSNRVIDLARSVRERGYAWEKDLEPKCLDYRKRWAGLRPGVVQTIDREAASLKARTASVEAAVGQAVAKAVSPAGAAAALPAARNAVDSLQGAAEAAAKTIDGMFDSLSSDLSTLESHLNEISWMLDQAAAAKVEWLAAESLVRAVKAKWDRDGKDDPKGILYLSDQRLAFERKEDVATKKVLFIATEKEKVQEALLIMPLAEVSGVTATKKGFLSHEDHLDFEFAPGASLRKAHFHIDGQDCNQWQAAVGRAKDGEIEKSRVEPVSEQEKARLRGAPTKCSSCGGVIKAPILRGQTEIHCSYCGAVTRF
jgi:hypothetical protein